MSRIFSTPSTNSVTGAANQVTASPTTGAVVVGLASVAQVATSLTIGGATIGTDALAVTGSTTLGGTTIGATGQVVGGSNIFAAAGSALAWATGSRMFGGAVDGNIRLSNAAGNAFSLLQFGGTTSSFPAWKRSTTSLQARLADDSAFTPVQGKLTTDVAATTGLGAGLLAALTNASLVLYDSTGQAYRVPCII